MSFEQQELKNAVLKLLEAGHIRVSPIACELCVKPVAVLRALWELEAEKRVERTSSATFKPIVRSKT